MDLTGKRVALLVEDLYEDLELWYPYYRMQEAGAEVCIVGTGKTDYKSKHGYPATADTSAAEASPDEYDAVLIPGGYAPDIMRRHKSMVDLVRKMHGAGKIVAFICHAGWLPISADIIRGRKVTSVSAIRDDMINAGGEFEDAEVVRDGNLISSRTPRDLPAYCRTIIEALTE